jgi:microcystin-dependent protein
MALESATYIDELVTSNPPQSDSLTQAAGHLRLIKAVLQATFPNFDEALTATPAEIDAVIAEVGTGQFVPAGSFTGYAGASLPEGYLWCDGTSYLRSEYAGLFTAISTTWGAADGTHFNVPNFKDRVLVGRGTMGATADAAIIDSLLTSTTLGATYDGEGAIDTITLATANIPAHTHTFSDSFSGTTGSGGSDHTHTWSDSATTSTHGGHTHSYTDQGQGTVPARAGGGGADCADNSSSGETTGSGGSHSHSVSVSGTTSSASAYLHTHTFSATASGTTSSTGSTTAFTVAILPPSIVVNWIIKT